MDRPVGKDSKVDPKCPISRVPIDMTCFVRLLTRTGWDAETIGQMTTRRTHLEMDWPVQKGWVCPSEAFDWGEARDTHLPVMKPRPIVPDGQKCTFLERVTAVECIVEIVDMVHQQHFITEIRESREGTAPRPGSDLHTRLGSC